jgi:hypothetical protein
MDGSDNPQFEAAAVTSSLECSAWQEYSSNILRDHILVHMKGGETWGKSIAGNS